MANFHQLWHLWYLFDFTSEFCFIKHLWPLWSSIQHCTRPQLHSQIGSQLQTAQHKQWILIKMRKNGSVVVWVWEKMPLLSGASVVHFACCLKLLMVNVTAESSMNFFKVSQRGCGTLRYFTTFASTWQQRPLAFTRHLEGRSCLYGSPLCLQSHA